MDRFGRTCIGHSRQRLVSRTSKDGGRYFAWKCMDCNWTGQFRGDYGAARAWREPHFCDPKK